MKYLEQLDLDKVIQILTTTPSNISQKNIRVSDALKIAEDYNIEFYPEDTVITFWLDAHELTVILINDKPVGFMEIL